MYVEKDGNFGMSVPEEQLRLNDAIDHGVYALNSRNPCDIWQVSLNFLHVSINECMFCLCCLHFYNILHHRLDALATFQHSVLICRVVWFCFAIGNEAIMARILLH